MKRQEYSEEDNRKFRESSMDITVFNYQCEHHGCTKRFKTKRPYMSHLIDAHGLPFKQTAIHPNIKEEK